MSHPIGDLQRKQLDHNFKYHAPKPGQAEVYEAIRAKGKELAELIASEVPTSREQATALTKVEEAVFWSNAGIARS